ncbi:hypothetical protein KGF56_000632 [Candida oxycetoniae]|uniref:Aldehyde dehydrogenase domain-containing protein n=1 Tax=Candida oxycetoniae TaxID=497107 RepID=A0AAI9T141_9ASCO|nr:uncharacterized protein KGF56_000632 [Candida oxycetoniae]KAI3406500.2 hypothetical protein KGF56_000632 [Candida oxycetoniae]
MSKARRFLSKSQASPIAPPQLDPLSSPETKPQSSHRISIKRSNHIPSLLDVAEKKDKKRQDAKQDVKQDAKLGVKQDGKQDGKLGVKQDPKRDVSHDAKSVSSSRSVSSVKSVSSLKSATSVKTDAKSVSTLKPTDKDVDSKLAKDTNGVARVNSTKTLVPEEKVEEKDNEKEKEKAKVVDFYTPLQEISSGVQRVTDGFKSGKTHSLQFRLNQLRNLYFAVKANESKLIEALQKDFYRTPSETKNYEFGTGLTELVFVMSNLHKWIKPEKVEDKPLNLITNNVYIERIPVGVVLVIAAFNYPLFVTISPIVGAIAAGNAVVLKQSELTPNFTRLFSGILTKALDKDIFFAVNGAIPETNELLNQKFDKIVFTGSNTVGKIVATKAAETLTPVILELGGKSPAIILDDVNDKDLYIVARRIAWGRFANAGQTCIGVDYVLVPTKLHYKFTAILKKVINEEFYPGLTKNDPNFTHIIHERAFNNLSKIIADSKGKTVVGGDADAVTRFIPPTVIDDVMWTDSTMQQEIFGPILPIIEYDSLSDAISKVTEHHDTPLAQYIFTSGPTSPTCNKQVKQILTNIRSGGAIINDVLMHISLHNAPFGGVGSSGYGAYHGKVSFCSFSHERTTIEQHLWNDFMLNARYPPHSNKKDNLIETSQVSYNGKVWFGRTGDVKINGPTTTFAVWNTALGLARLVRDFVGASM